MGIADISSTKHSGEEPRSEMRGSGRIPQKGNRFMLYDNVSSKLRLNAEDHFPVG